ncbi:hypothetical protein AAC387_Pa10g2202 [Persea americana]
MLNPERILTLLQGCNSMQRLRKIHAKVLVNGYQDHPSLSLKLLSFCSISVSGDLTYARLLFDRMPNPQTPAWNSIIRGSSQRSPFPLDAIFLYNRMMMVLDDQSASRPDTITFSFLLRACERARADQKCREAHGSIIRTGHASDVALSTNLVRAYAGNGDIDNARRVFDEMPRRDLVAWNAMISCYSQAGLHEATLNLYELMRVLGVGLDEFTVVGLLSSCAHVGALNLGVEMHRFADQNRFLGNVFVCNALIDMYAKCGNLDGARLVFNHMRRRDVLTWNSMIVGLGIHGRGSEAMSFFRRMSSEGFLPDPVTFLGLLCGCSHQGLVKEGVECFQMMSSEFNLTPGVKHYGCMVDLFGRAGKLESALKIISTSPPGNDPVLWRTLLSASKIHRNVKMGEVAMGNLVRIEACNAGDCVLLSGIYAEAGDRQGVARMRKMIRYQGIKTTPGWSWIEIGSIVHRFVVGDKSHPDTKEIHQKLKEMIHRASMIGYVEDKCLMPLLESTEEWSEEWSENTGHYHSEKLAIAFGLLRTDEATSLRLVKNLRICRDCHSLTKFISKVFNREIIVRDRVRFHHFRDGLCSCKDYW